MLLGLWGVGDLMIIFLAALLDVPDELYEAAALDGANAWQQFRYVTLPSDLAGDAVRRGHRGHRDVAVLHPGRGRRERRIGQATTGGGISSTFGYPEGSTFTYPLWLYVGRVPLRRCSATPTPRRRAVRRRDRRDR